MDYTIFFTTTAIHVACNHNSYHQLNHRAYAAVKKCMECDPMRTIVRIVVYEFCYMCMYDQPQGVWNVCV